MYRVSREGRRASSNNHGADTPPRGSYKDRFAHSASSAYDKKSFSTPASNRPFFRNPKVQVYFKIAGVVASFFFLRGLHRSMCADNLHVQLDSTIAGSPQELDSTIAGLRKSLEEEIVARRKAEDTVADLVSKDRAHAGLHGPGFDAPMIFGDIENENSHGDMLSDEQPAGDLTDLLEEAKADYHVTLQALESKNHKLEQQVQSLQAEVESRRSLGLKKAEGDSERDGGGGGGGRGDSNEASGDASFRVGGGEARGNGGLMKHRFGRQTASGEGSDRAKAGVYRADDGSGKAKSGETQLKKASPDGKLPSPNQWIIGVGSGGQPGEAEEHEEGGGDDSEEEEAEGGGGGGGRGAPADIDSHDPFANVNWGRPGILDGAHSQDPASPSVNGEDGMTFDVHVDSGVPGQASGEKEETLAEKYGRAGKREDTPNDKGMEDGGSKPFEATPLGKAMEDAGSNGSGEVQEGKGAKGKGSVAGDTGDWEVEEGVDWAKVERAKALADKNSEDEDEDEDEAKRPRKGFLRRPTGGGAPVKLAPRSKLVPPPLGRIEASGGGELKGNDEMSMGRPVESEGGAEDSSEEDFFDGLRRGGEAKKEEEEEEEEEKESDTQSGDDEERGDSGGDDDEEHENSKEEDDDLEGGGDGEGQGADAAANGETPDWLAKPIFESEDLDVDEKRETPPPPTVASPSGVISKARSEDRSEDRFEEQNGDRSNGERDSEETPPPARNGNLRGSAVDVGGAVPKDEAALGKAELSSVLGDDGVEDQDEEEESDDREEEEGGAENKLSATVVMEAGTHERDGQSDGGLEGGAGNDEPGALEAGVEPGTVERVGEKEGAGGGGFRGRKNEERLRAAADGLDEEAPSSSTQGGNGGKTRGNAAGRENGGGGGSSSASSGSKNRGKVGMRVSTDQEADQPQVAAAVAAEGLLLPSSDSSTDDDEEEEESGSILSSGRGSSHGGGRGGGHSSNGGGRGRGGRGGGRIDGDGRKGRGSTPDHRSDDDAEAANVNGNDDGDDGSAHSTIGGRPRKERPSRRSQEESSSSLSSPSSSSTTRRDDDDAAYEESGGDSEDDAQYEEDSSGKLSFGDRPGHPPAPRHEIPDAVLLKRDEDARKFMARPS